REPAVVELDAVALHRGCGDPDQRQRPAQDQRRVLPVQRSRGRPRVSRRRRDAILSRNDRWPSSGAARPSRQTNASYRESTNATRSFWAAALSALNAARLAAPWLP